MKNIVLIFLLLPFFTISAQESEKAAVQKAIETFFNGFHEQDSIQIKSMVSNSVILQTVMRDGSGKTSVKTQELGDFLKSIVGIPKTTKFQEVIKSYSIQIDGAMANAWTPYEFKIDNSFHHCGVNSFQLVKDAVKGWQIIYLIDTRRKEGCD